MGGTFEHSRSATVNLGVDSCCESGRQAFGANKAAISGATAMTLLNIRWAPGESSGQARAGVPEIRGTFPAYPCLP